MEFCNRFSSCRFCRLVLYRRTIGSCCDDAVGVISDPWFFVEITVLIFEAEYEDSDGQTLELDGTPFGHDAAEIGQVDGMSGLIVGAFSSFGFVGASINTNCVYSFIGPMWQLAHMFW